MIWGTDAASAGDQEEVYQKFIRGGQMQPQRGSGRGLLEVYQGWTDAASAGYLEEFYQKIYEGWTDAASAGDLEEVYKKFIRGGQMQPQLVIQKRFIRSL